MKPNEKKDRNKDVVRCYRERKDLTLAQIGELFGVSRQRIFQIVKKG